MQLLCWLKIVGVEISLQFHRYLGWCRIPKIGGKALDLHFLYVEVTSRGGCQQVCFTHLLLGVSEVPHYYTEVFWYWCTVGKLWYNFLNIEYSNWNYSFYIVDLGAKLSILPLFKQVIKDRKWKELQVAFNFPHTTTSAAYVLRKYYIGLLHHYEQVYFLGTQGPLVPPPSRLHTLGAPRL